MKCVCLSDGPGMPTKCQFCAGRASAERELLEAALAFKAANEAWSAAFRAASVRVGDAGLLTPSGALEELAPETIPLCHESNRCQRRLTAAALGLP